MTSMKRVLVEVGLGGFFYTQHRICSARDPVANANSLPSTEINVRRRRRGLRQ